MFKKIVIALVLVVVIAAISYVKTQRAVGHSDSEAKADSIRRVEQLWSYQIMVDSLKELVKLQETEHAKAMYSKEMRYKLEIDSLLVLLDSTEESSLADTSASSEEKPVEVVPELTPEQMRFRADVLDHYLGLYEELPKDLSAYERRVALAEIRLKTAEECEISLNQLHEIRQQGGLSY